MSTRSRIGRINQNGTVESVYCHSDGYPSHNGMMLTSYLNSQESADKIVGLGGLSSLGESIEQSRFYVRDYKEELADNAAEKHESLSAFLKEVSEDIFIEFTYLWDGEKWCAWNGAGRELDLKTAIEEDR